MLSVYTSFLFEAFSVAHPSIVRVAMYDPNTIPCHELHVEMIYRNDSFHFLDD